MFQNSHSSAVSQTDKNESSCFFEDGDDAYGPDVAQIAYHAARDHLIGTQSLNDEEKALLFQGSSIEDAHQVIAISLADCEAVHNSSKARKWLHRASEMICHYGTVLDVFVQHHPEYVSLVWGLWKLLFTVSIMNLFSSWKLRSLIHLCTKSVLNHGETLKLLAKTMTQLGRRLPMVKVAAKLYPTGQMRTAVEGLYAGMVTFLLKTHEWLHEPKWKRAYHNITRPPVLQYGDVLEQIEGCSKDIIEIATLSSHKELRAMHTSQNEQLYQITKRLEAADHDRGAQIRGLRHLLSSLGHSQLELQRKVDLVLSLLQAAGISIQDLLVKTDTHHSIQMNAHLNTNDRLTDLQLAQTLASLSSSFNDPHKCFQRHLLLRKRRASGIAVVASTNEFWQSPALKSFSVNHDSDMVIIKGTFGLRAAIRDFGVDAIRALTRSDIATIWALEGADSEKSRWSNVDFLRYLTWQVLRNSKLTEKQMSVRYSQFQTAQTPMDWMRLFREVVKHVGGQLYLIVDLMVMRASLATVDGFNIINELNELIRSSAQERNFVLKIIVLTYDTDWQRMLPSELGGSIISVKKATSRKLPRKQNRNLRFSKA